MVIRLKNLLSNSILKSRFFIVFLVSSYLKEVGYDLFNQISFLLIETKDLNTKNKIIIIDTRHKKQEPKINYILKIK